MAGNGGDSFVTVFGAAQQSFIPSIMKHVIHSIAFILVALMSTGCFGPSEKGRDFSVRETRSLVQGESTKADVRQLLASQQRRSRRERSSSGYTSTPWPT